MKITTRTRFYGLALAAITVALAGCFGGSSTPPPDIIVPPPVVTAPPVVLQAAVKDASTGALVSPTSPAVVTISVYGTDANKVVDINGTSLYSASTGFAGPLTTSSGLLAIYVKPGTPVPSQMNLRVVASANGYVTSSDDVVIKGTDVKTDGSTTGVDVSISLVKVSAPPPSVTVVTAPITVTAGVSPATVTTNKTPESTAVVNGATVNLGSATVAVPATTTIYADAAKTVPLPAGTTTVSVTYNNSVTSNSLAAFPGGLSMSQSETGAALSTPSVFVTAGFASIEVASTAANGTVTQAKTFDKPLAVTIPIPQGTIDPVTDLPMKVGDVIPVWSYDSTSGAWSVLKLNNGTIVTGTLGALDTSNNTFPVTFATDHLTYFSLGKNVPPAKTCSNAALTVNGAQGKALDFVITKQSGGWSYQGTLAADSAAPASATLAIGSAPTGAVTVTVYQDNTALSGYTVSNLCTATAPAVSVSPRQTPTSTVTINVRKVCTQDSTAITPVQGVSVIATDSSGRFAKNWITGTAGVAQLAGLIVGSTYTFKVTGFADVSYTVLASGNSVTMSQPVSCTVVSGG